MRGNVDAGPVVPNMVHSEADYVMVRNADGTESPQRIFRRHKTLPRPGTASSTGSRSSSPAQPPRTTQLRRSRYRPAGPEPPPTPPAHSRTSSSAKSMKSIDRSSPTNSGSPLQSTDTVQHVQSRLPTTPPNQRTPPTPNLTPERIPPPAPEPPVRPARPQLQIQTQAQSQSQSQFSAQSRPRPRLVVDDRMPSNATTIYSRSESFRTAPEAPITPEDEDDGKSKISSRRTSKSTIRQANRGAKLQPQTVGLGIDIGVNSSVGDGLTPAAERQVQLGRDAYDGGWGGQGTQGGNLNSDEEVEEEWDENLERNVIVSRRRAAPRSNMTKDRNSVFMEPPTTVTPTTKVATRVLPLRAMNLEEQQRALPRSEPSTSGDTRRFSTTSNQSGTSTIMGTIVVGDDTGSQRRNTLRHARKPTLSLRDSVSDLAPSTTSFAPAPAPAPVLAPAPQVFQRRPPFEPKSGAAPRESYFSTTSISSRKARRDVWKTGSIPVVIVPERRTSLKSNGRPPSLRSMSSRRSRRSQSLSSVGRSQASASNFTIDIYMDEPRRSRTISESDRSRAGGPRTADFPPYIPRRSSSLSAPASRNVSRTGSLTAESLRAHDALFEQQKASQTVERAVEKLQREKRRSPPKPVNTSRHYRKTIDGNDLEPERRQSGTINIKFSPSIQSSNFDNSDPRTPRSFPADHNDDGGPRHSYEYNKRNSVQHTPFSQASVETGTSHAEVSEARAIPIYPHQNKSVMIVNHSNKPSEASSSDRQRSPPTATPAIAATDAEGNPITPPTQGLSREDDNFSPLRNPRAPPKPPPAINFIPATPSGLTPTTEKEKELGGFYDDMAEPEEPKPESGFAMLRRKLSRRRTSETTGSRPGFLTRTFSLSKYTKNYESDGGSSGRLKRPHLKRSFTADDAPVEPDKLHPDWRPSYQSDFSDSGSEDEEHWDYPPIDNRPQRPGHLLPKRSLSQRMKKAFAIMPLRNGSKYDATYLTDSGDVPDRDKRTIRRTPSGNLRVMKIRQSLEFMAQSMARPSISSERPTRPSISSPSETPPRPSTSTEAPPRPSISPDSSSTRPSMSSENPRFYPPRVRRNYGALFQRQRPPPSPAAVSSAAPPLTPSSVSTFATGHSVSPPITTTAAPVPPPMKRRGSLSEKILPVLNEKVNIVRRMSEKRKEKKRDEMRKTISHPRVVRDGLGEVIKHDTGREIFAMSQGQTQPQQGQRQSPPAVRGSPPSRLGRGSPI
ncbi:hypothetical protein B0H65DRAFT_116510 [Neurospora tetraspora]|uniref:Uncharacterized protein n=1 Tax=Neurospora tetraspora TaxID=94610 RepID=A0AAE0JKM3_9PEZI|nr:hypothetical protein B0H65DRAFT_116510 [Neurospora tetraspora]